MTAAELEGIGAELVEGAKLVTLHGSAQQCANFRHAVAKVYERKASDTDRQKALALARAAVYGATHPRAA